MSHLPPGWVERESKSHPGQIYYFNSSTGESSWHPPQGNSHVIEKEFSIFCANIVVLDVLPAGETTR
eukprot:scaffold912_cov187-Ochromonas_danica.AAC.40